MRSAVRLGHVSGVEVIADITVFVVAGVIGWLHSLVVRDFDAGALAGLLGVVAAAGYLGSLIVHESLHSVVATRRGTTPRRIRLHVFGGYTAINDRDFEPSDEFWVAIAGPAASLVTGGVLLTLGWVTGFNEALAETFRFLGLLNLLIAAFNVLPGLPLDGGRALHAVLWNLTGDRVKASRRAALAGRILGLGVAFVGIFLIVGNGDIAGIAWILLGWFVYQSAEVAGKREELIAMAAGKTAGDVMQPSPDAVPGPMRIAEVTALFQSGPVMRTLPVAVDGRVTGMIGQAEIEALTPGRRELGRAASVMTPIGPDDLVDANTPLDAVVARMPAKQRFVVVDEGVAVGVIEARDVLRGLA